MENLVIENGTVITPLAERRTNLWLSGGKVLHLGDSLVNSQSKLDCKSFKSIDATGCYVTPGLVDLQMNGGPDLDLWEALDNKGDKLRAMRRELALSGTTAFLPTLITTSSERFSNNQAFLRKAIREEIKPGEGLARMPGIHLEGPCLSAKRPGVHPPEHIKPFTPDELQKIVPDYDDVILMTAACEGDPRGEALAYLRERGVNVSLGHSDATFEEAERAFNEYGVRLLTHVFNALPPLHHRMPGAVGAALLNKKVTCCLIADGLHLAPETCKLVFALKGRDKLILVTDRAHIGTSRGGLVGSSIRLDDAVRNMTNWGITSFAETVRMASYNPARALGLDDLGELAPGKAADVVLFDKNLAVKSVIIAGEPLLTSSLV